MFGQAQLTLRHRLHELFGLLGKTLRHSLGFFHAESLKLVEQRHLFDFLFGIFFHLRSLARHFCLVNLGFAFGREIGARSHGKGRSQHSRQARDEHEMLLVIGGAGHA